MPQSQAFQEIGAAVVTTKMRKQKLRTIFEKPKLRWCSVCHEAGWCRLSWVRVELNSIVHCE